MSVKVRCTSCDKVLTVPDAARGKAIKCPECDTRIAVPASSSATSKPAADKKKKPAAAKSARPVDSEDALASLDLRRVEDTNARICSKCGYDMQEMDEEETECPKCGFDIEAGGMGLKARKRAMKGPDPADFYPGLSKEAIKFTLKNQGLAWRTDLYVFVCLLVSLGCGFMYLWISPWPPRAFFALCFFVAFMVIPGWLWNLDTEVIKLTLERKDKFKRLNFDFFLASAKGVMSVAWLVVGAGPILLIPGAVGYYMVHYNGSPPWVLGVCLGIGAIPVIWMLPVVMAHMTMPIPTPGWMIWKVMQFAFRSVGGCTVWFMWLVLSCVPLIGGAAVIGAVWGNDINAIVQTMESNADLNRRILAAEKAPKSKNVQPIDPASLGKPADVNFMPLIGPGIVLAVMCLPLGFIAMFNMRTNGQFTYYFRDRLELIDKAKEYKYVAKERRNPDDEDAPRTLKQDATEGIVLVLVCALLGTVGGMLYGALSSAGVGPGIIAGTWIGLEIAGLITGIAIISTAFRVSIGWGFIVWLVPFGVVVFVIKHWEMSRKLVFQWLATVVLLIILVIVTIAVGVSAMSAPQPGQGPQMDLGVPGQMPPGQMAPGQMAPGQMAPGMHGQAPGQPAPGQMAPGSMPGQMPPGQPAQAPPAHAPPAN